MHRLALIASAPLFIGSVAGADRLVYVPVYTLTGDGSEIFGMSARSAGDVNNDGRADIIVRGMTRDASETAHVFSGATGAELFSVGGVSGHLWLGCPIAGAGDVDGDGFDDVIIGNWVDNVARVISSLDQSELAVLPGPRGADGFGAAVSGAADLNNDGFADVVVGHVGGTGPDQTIVYSGADGSVLYTFDGSDEFGETGLGWSVDRAGDVNGDGVEDLIVGAAQGGPIYENPGFPPFIPPFLTRYPNGSARVFSGADGTELYEFLATEKVDFGALDGFSFSVSGAGDLNNDGRADLIVGTESIEFDPRGAGGFARAYSGADGSELFTFLLDDAVLDSFVSVDGMGDVNGDGHDDVIVGSNHARSGFVRIYSGAGGSELFALEIPKAFMALPMMVRSAGDVNADGLVDFAVAMPQAVYGLGFAQVFLSQRPDCPSDLDASGAVDPGDLAILLGAWGQCRGCAADIDGDGDVDAADLTNVLAAWGNCQ